MRPTPSAALCFFFFFFFLVEEAKCSSYRQQMLSAFNHSKLPFSLAQASNVTRNGRVFYPIGYGADPTGAEDSTDALLKAVEEAFQLKSELELLPGITDLGGVVIDLQGGNYKISQPLRFPSGAGNVVVQGGSLRGSSTFPGDRHLIELWSPSSQKLKQKTTITSNAFFFDEVQNNNVGIYYEDITFRDILFDSSFRGGGIFIVDSARIRITNCFFLHFTTEGILVHKGHETFISNTFLGQHSTVGGDKGERDFTGTAIDLDSNDNAITDVVIFSAAIGIMLRGQANVVTGVHCYNKATGFGGIGILVKLAGNSQTRLDNCYLDFNAIVLEDPVQVHVTNGFFLGDANIVLKSVNGKVFGLNIVNNMFTGSSQVPIVQLEGQFGDIDQVVIDQNNVVGMGLKSTVGRLNVEGNGTNGWLIFLLFWCFPTGLIISSTHFIQKGRPSSQLML
ncbi:polygalacturonase QRT3 [Prunus yedoensis var. nudiflora]|uniref:Polygalacturonase QRT3 n=1 Tax=Prunus yedoensis var. nudiflora TaxID=2094558 RepID=A0A314ZN95_PRUYE|nr:polygalacturonase QRT3 [Prunus yedoensis var. nudiflora]